MSAKDNNFVITNSTYSKDKNKNKNIHRTPIKHLRHWRDVFDEIDYSWYAQNPNDNVYVYG